MTVAADTVRVRSARGTHQQQRWATVGHATIYPTMVCVFLQVAANIAQRDWLWTGISLATALFRLC